ncbi:MAG: hypothetical protein WBZ36_26660 [Candidatus Nitrosopolaris sp.]
MLTVLLRAMGTLRPPHSCLSDSRFAEAACAYEPPKKYRRITDGVKCLIQSDFKSGNHGNFEVVVLEGNNLAHWWHDNSDVNNPWQRGQVISTAATGPGSIIQSDFKSGKHGNFEVVVLEGNNLAHWWHDNSDVNNPWQRGLEVEYP